MSRDCLEKGLERLKEKRTDAFGPPEAFKREFFERARTRRRPERTAGPARASSALRRPPRSCWLSAVWWSSKWFRRMGSPPPDWIPGAAGL